MISAPWPERTRPPLPFEEAGVSSCSGVRRHLGFWTARVERDRRAPSQLDPRPAVFTVAWSAVTRRASQGRPLARPANRSRANGPARRVSCHIGATASNVGPRTCINANGVPRVASIWHETPVFGVCPRPGGGAGDTAVGRARSGGSGGAEASQPGRAARWGDRWGWNALRGSGGRVPEFGWSQLGVTEITLESGAGVGKVRLVMMACKWCAPMLSRNRVHLQFVTNRSRTSGDTVTSASLGTG